MEKNGAGLKRLMIKETTIAFAVLILALYSIFYFMGYITCSRDVVETAVSPSGKYKVISYLKSCGANSPSLPQVILLPQWEPFAGQNSNVFSGDSGMFVMAQWAGDNKILVKYDCRENCIVLKQKKVYGIDIEYQRMAN